MRYEKTEKILLKNKKNGKKIKIQGSKGCWRSELPKGTTVTDNNGRELYNDVDVCWSS